MLKLLIACGALAGLAFAAGVALAQGGGGVPPPDPSPPDPPRVVNAHVQNEVVLRGVELDDLLQRAAGRPVPCEGECRKARDPQAVAEFIANSCRSIHGLAFSEGYARDWAPDIAKLAAALEASCRQVEAKTQGLGPLDSSEAWRSAAADIHRELPTLIEPASGALLEVLK